MEVDLPVTPADASGADDFVRTLALQRKRMQQFVAAQQERIDRIVGELAARMQGTQAALEHQQQELSEREAALAEAERDLCNKQAELGTPAGGTSGTPRKAGAISVAQETNAFTAGSSWEQEKRRILAALEAEGEPADAQRAAERLRIAEVLRCTDAALAEKDRELERLRQSLAGRGGSSLDAADQHKALDADVLIREERENLRQLQAHWEEMLRSAEIELSLERAKLARERAQIDEKVRSAHVEASIVAASGSPQKSPRGRWLARLGLKDDGDAE